MLLRLLLARMRDESGTVTKESVTRHNRGIVDAIESSMLDRAVLLALDSPHDEDGREMSGGSAVVCANDYVASLCGTSGKTLFGASIHPYRKDALQQLERCIENGACLVKWVPSAQNIDPRDERCFPFYEMLSAYKLPLLSHTGIEHTLNGRNNGLNDPARLVPALKYGVTVIAAHCGARMMLHERSYFDSWCKMVMDHENCYGDISAFIIPTRLHLLSRIRNDEQLLAKVLFGSDFPGFPDLLSCLFRIGVGRTLALRSEHNPFNRSLRAFQELGMPEAVFSRAGRLLRLSGSPKAAA